MIEFRASAVTDWRDDEFGTEALILAENDDGSGQRVEIQRPLNPTDEDRRLGQDTYCVCDDEGAVYYGGIDRWVVLDGIVELHLAPDAAAALRLQDGFRVRLDDPSSQEAVVDAALTRLVGKG